MFAYTSKFAVALIQLSYGTNNSAAKVRLLFVFTKRIVKFFSSRLFIRTY